MKRKLPFRLVSDSLSDDTIICLEELLEMARSGEVIGVCVVVMCKGRKYLVDTTGEAQRSPTFARGMLRALDDELSRRVWDE